METQQQEQPQIRSSPYQSPMNNYGSAILFMTNPEQELYKLELSLRSQILDKDGNPHKIGEPLLNDRGISAVLGQIQPIVNRVTIMSSLDTKREIPNLMDFLGDTLAKDLMLNAPNYELKPNDRDKVYFMVLASSFICMKRAATDSSLSDKKFWRGSVQEINTTVGNQQSKGILSRMGWGKNH